MKILKKLWKSKYSQEGMKKISLWNVNYPDSGLPVFDGNNSERYWNMKKGYKRSDEDGNEYLGKMMRVKSKKYFDDNHLYLDMGDIALVFKVVSKNSETISTSDLKIYPSLEDVTRNIDLNGQPVIEIFKMNLSYAGYMDRNRISFWDMEKAKCPYRVTFNKI